MAYWIGVGFALAAIWFARAAVRHRAHVKAELSRMLERGQTPAKLHGSLEILADAAPAIVSLFLFCAGALTVVAFFAVGAQRVFSLFDLGGYLTFLVAYGYWLNIKTTYRLIEPAGAVAAAAD